MSGRPIKKGATDQSTIIRIVDSTDGTPETAVTSATAGLDLSYRREGGLVVDLTESDLLTLDAAHSDGGLLHIGDGYYRLDLPDAAFATGANGVLVFGTVTGMVVIGTYHPLIDYDPQDSVRLGLTALPNAVADAAGGLPISDAGGLDLDQLDSNVDSILADTGTDGVVVAAASKTGYSLSAAGIDAIFDEVYETGRTLREHLRLAASALWGKLSGAGTTSIAIRDQNDTKNRITATVDSDGNRSAVTTDDT